MRAGNRGSGARTQDPVRRCGCSKWQLGNPCGLGGRVSGDGPWRQDRTLELANAAVQLLGLPCTLTGQDINVDGSQRGTAYGMPTDDMKAAVRLLASEEALLLDPVYSGKAFAGLLAGIAAGRYKPGQNVLFVMTGGTPGLYAYRSEFDHRPA